MAKAIGGSAVESKVDLPPPVKAWSFCSPSQPQILVCPAASNTSQVQTTCQLLQPVTKSLLLVSASLRVVLLCACKFPLDKFFVANGIINHKQAYQSISEGESASENTGICLSDTAA